MSLGMIANKVTAIGPERYDDFSRNLTTFAPANESNLLVDLVDFQEYNPCVFLLTDTSNFNASSNRSSCMADGSTIYGSTSVISLNNHSAGVTLGAENTAPLLSYTEAFGGSASKSTAGQIRAGVPIALAGLIGAMLFVLML